MGLKRLRNRNLEAKNEGDDERREEMMNQKRSQNKNRKERGRGEERRRDQKRSQQRNRRERKRKRRKRHQLMMRNPQRRNEGDGERREMESKGLCDCNVQCVDDTDNGSHRTFRTFKCEIVDVSILQCFIDLEIGNLSFKSALDLIKDS